MRTAARALQPGAGETSRMLEIKPLSSCPRLSLPRPRSGRLRTQGVSEAALREEVDEYFQVGARVSAGDVVVDVGANVGAFALAAAEQVDGDLTLHCFEPAAPTFAILQENFHANPLLQRARHTLHCAALTRPDEAGAERDFYFFKRLPTDSTYDIVGKRLEFERFFAGHAVRLEREMSVVPLIGRALGGGARAVIERLSSPESPSGVWLTDRFTGLATMRCWTDTLGGWARAARVPRIDLMKIDVEGAELHVLEGVGGFWPRVRQVVVETNEHGGMRQRVTDLLRAKGFGAVEAYRPRLAALRGTDNVLLRASRSD